MTLDVEIKSKGEYFMTSIKGRYFRRVMDERSSIIPEVPSFYRGHKVRTVSNICLVPDVL